MLRIWLMAMCAAATLTVARDHQVLHRAGLVGYCTSAPRPAGTTGDWRACQKGTLDGRRERARGRGAYRALIRARWDDAAALGTPALITQGGSMSRPILERLGFVRVGEGHMLLDRFGSLPPA